MCPYNIKWWSFGW